MTQIEILIYFFATYLILAFVPVGLWLLHRGDKMTLLHTFLSSSLAVMVSSLIKNFYYLPRPFIYSGNLPIISYRLDGSLPSSHTALAFAISFSIFRKNRRLGLFLIFISFLIAFGRIAGGVHTVLDVLIGIFVAQICFVITKRILRD